MDDASATDALQAEMDETQRLCIRLRGDWLLQGAETPSRGAFLNLLDEFPGTQILAFDSEQLGRWDASLLIGLDALTRAAQARDVEVDARGLPDGAQRLLQLARAVAVREDAHRTAPPSGLLASLGDATLRLRTTATELLRFTGELVFSMLRLVRGKAVFDPRDLLLYIEQTGARALPIVSLIAFLVGVILAFVGVRQLEQFGAGIYVADLVAIAMVREMAAIMTGIIMAGRSGAAFAAQIGTMKVNEEIDALTTLGIPAMDYLVLPRTIALVLMMPLLSVYAGLLGIIGGGLVALAMLDVNVMQYMEQTRNAIDLHAVLGGLLKAVVFGGVIALSGCYQGMACGGSAMAVGKATTAAVVMAILLIVVTASALTVIYTVYGV